MALILSMETSAEVCSVALHRDGELLALSEVHIAQSHATKLAPSIEALQRMAGVRGADMDGVAVSAGPGSYTGLRIGASTAKGLCYALDIPLMAVNTLELLVYQGIKQIGGDVYYCPMIDARRMEVYCMVADKAGHVLRPVEAKVVVEDSFNDLLEESTVVFYGDGASKCAEVIRHPRARFYGALYPSVTALGELAYVKWQKKEFEDNGAFEPFYLKGFVPKLGGGHTGGTI